MSDLSLPFGYDPREPQFLARAPDERSAPVCPVCGEECSTIYKKDGEVIGCDECIDSMDAYDYQDEEDEQWQ